jgi:L-iditol 2-dehydrogenase
MRAAVLYDNNLIQVEELKERKLKENELRIAVKAAGICGSDTHKLQTKWKYPLPAVMGHEFAGEVMEIGEKVEKFSVGDRVAGIPFLPCYACEFCQSGKYSLCENYEMIGSHYYGGFAESVIVPERNALAIGNLSFEEGAMIEPLAVAMHGIKGIDPDIGDVVLIFGAGNIGLLTIQALKVAGVEKIIAVDITNTKLKEAQYFGADEVIHSMKEDLETKVAEYTQGKGVDIALECAGTPITQEQALRVVKKHGKVGYIGIAYKDVHLSENSFERIFRHELTVKGFWNSYSAPFPGGEWTKSLSFVKQGRINVKDMVTHRFPLEDTKKAFEMILKRKEEFNKVMIIP